MRQMHAASWLGTASSKRTNLYKLLLPHRFRNMLLDENKQRPQNKTQHEGIFLGSLTKENKMLNLWFANLKICSNHLKFKIDTRAEISVINPKTYKNLWNKPPLRLVERRSRRPGGTLRKKLHIRGKCTKWSGHRKITVQIGCLFDGNGYQSRPSLEHIWPRRLHERWTSDNSSKRRCKPILCHDNEGDTVSASTKSKNLTGTFIRRRHVGRQVIV